jgi:hypothetical protein
MLAGATIAAAITASQSNLRREMSCDPIGSLMEILDFLHPKGEARAVE